MKITTSEKLVFREAKTPQPIETKGSKHVTWGERNLYPQELVTLREDNPIHGGILNQKVTFISAAGAEVITSDAGLAQSIKDLIENVAEDNELFNGFAVLVRKVPTGWALEHIDFETVRACSDGVHYGVSDDWSTGSQTAKNNYREYKSLDKAIFLGDNSDKEALLYAIKKPKQGKLQNGKVRLCYYPTPSYIGALTSIMAGIEQDFFTYSEAVNGYKGGTLVNLANGSPESEEKAEELARNIKGAATKREIQGGIIVTFSDGKDNAPEVMQLNGNDLDKRYIESNKEIRNKILVGHSVGSPTLFGVSGESMFGSKEEMETAYTLFSNNYVVKRQNFIKNALEWACKMVGESVVINWNKYDLVLSQETSNDNRTLKQLNSMSPLVATKVLDSMTPDEVRQLARLAPKTVEELSDVKNKNIISKLSSLGVPRGSVVVKGSRSFDLQSTDEDFITQHNTFVNLYDLQSVDDNLLTGRSTFADLSKAQQLIVQLISDGKSFSEIAVALGKGALATSLELIKLNAKGVLRGWKVVSVKDVKLEVLYSYEVKTGLGAQVIPRTREFCRELVQLDRLYKRSEIDQLSNELDTDVWRYRGGWYSNPNTGKNTPSCRHEWRQNIV
jgi:hypothetical protein